MIINSPSREQLPKNKWKVFVAGPIQGAPDWQNTMPEIENVVWLSPRRKSYENFDYIEQTSWEHDHLYAADIVLFWVPPEVEKIEGRGYAQTTRTEFGEYLALGKNIIFGCYSEFPGKRYFQTKLDEYGKSKFGVFGSLEDCIGCLKSFIQERENNPKTFYTSDTHFGDTRALELSKRPFFSVEQMDWMMIKNWNNTVHPCDTIYHLGDFGNQEVLNYLSGTINFVYGNYERDGKYVIDETLFNRVYKRGCLHSDLILCHEPLFGKDYIQTHSDIKGALFGHIHGRQKIKEFGIDVGVDGNNYTPVSQEEVDFYLNAIEKGYYDEEVWS